MTDMKKLLREAKLREIHVKMLKHGITLDDLQNYAISYQDRELIMRTHRKHVNAAAKNKASLEKAREARQAKRQGERLV
jgi:hypothetical protein